MDLARQILLAVEQAPFNAGTIDVKVPGRSDETISYHVMLLHQAGLLQATDFSTMGNREWKPTSLTWEGHEFLEASRNETTWRKTLATVKDKGGGTIFEVVKSLLVEAAKRAVLPP